MKLATIERQKARTESERRDGQLVVVNDAAGMVAMVPDDVAANMLEAIRSWDSVEPALRAIDAALKEGGEGPQRRPLEACRFLAPMPRSTCWIDGSAYIQHIILVRKARNAEPPEDLRETPLMYQGVSDPMLPHDAVIDGDESWGMDFEAEVGVILDDVPRGTTSAEAGRHVKLLCLLNDISLRLLIPRELKAGFGFFQGKPPSAFAPYVVTPDELEHVWKDGRLHLKMETWLNGERFGDPDAGPEMFFSFPQLIEHAARTRPLPAGTVLGSGTVSNEDEGRGSSCLAEKRMIETIRDGKPTTPFLQDGDLVRIDVRDGGRSVFGTIEQKVRAL